MSTPFRKAPLKPAHGLSVDQVQRLRKTQTYWLRILDMPICRDTARAKAQHEVDSIQRMLGHG